MLTDKELDYRERVCDDCESYGRCDCLCIRECMTRDGEAEIGQETPSEQLREASK